MPDQPAQGNGNRTAPTITVVGSVNLDLVATVPRLPMAGETVSGAELHQYPGGKGANQALAAKRLGAAVTLIARVGDDAAAETALALLRLGNVDLQRCTTDVSAATGIALIAVAPSGENQIVVAPGANRELLPDTVALPDSDAVICQLEVPMATIDKVAAATRGFFCLNIAPAAPVPGAVLRRADLLVMNETEAAFIGADVEACPGLIAITYGADGATLFKAGKALAKTRPPTVTSVDSTGAGDTFTAALTLRLIEGAGHQEALDFACAAGALATTKKGAQPSFPVRCDVHNLLTP